MLVSLHLPVTEALAEGGGGGGTSWTLWGQKGWGPPELPAWGPESAAPAFPGLVASPTPAEPESAGRSAHATACLGRAEALRLMRQASRSLACV